MCPVLPEPCGSSMMLKSLKVEKVVTLCYKGGEMRCKAKADLAKKRKGIIVVLSTPKSASREQGRIQNARLLHEQNKESRKTREDRGG
jgi:hypothetical protein